MIGQNSLPTTYTPEEVAIILKLSKNTVYDLINKGEIRAKKFGKAYRISPRELSFVFTGLDEDLYRMDQEDVRNIAQIHDALRTVRQEAS